MLLVSNSKCMTNICQELVTNLWRIVLVAILPRSLDQLLPLKLYNCPKVLKPEQKLKETKADICHTPEISVTLVCHFFFHDYDFGLKGTPPEKKCFLLSIARKG